MLLEDFYFMESFWLGLRKIVLEACLKMHRYTRAVLVSALTLSITPAVLADLLTFQWDGVHAANSLVKDLPIQAVFTIDTDTPRTSVTQFTIDGQTATSHVYEGAIVSGYYKVGEHLFPLVTSGSIVTGSHPLFGDITVAARNNVTILENGSSGIGTRYTRFAINGSTDHQERGGITPGTVLFHLFDHDVPRDTIIGYGLDQPLQTLRLPSQGGVDRAVFGMGARVGVVSTVTSGEGHLKAVPEPGSLALLGLGTLAMIRRRRPA